MLLVRIAQALEAARLPYAVVGGYALALHGAMRGTVDVDLVIRFREADFQKLEKVMSSLGLVSRLPVTAREVFQFREEYLRNRNLRAWSFVNPSVPADVVDIILSEDLARMKVKRIKFRGQVIRVASVQDLIRMKQKSDRLQDQEDVKSLKELS